MEKTQLMAAMVAPGCRCASGFSSQLHCDEHTGHDMDDAPTGGLGASPSGACRGAPEPRPSGVPAPTRRATCLRSGPSHTATAPGARTAREKCRPALHRNAWTAHRHQSQSQRRTCDHIPPRVLRKALTRVEGDGAVLQSQEMSQEPSDGGLVTPRARQTCHGSGDQVRVRQQAQAKQLEQPA